MNSSKFIGHTRRDDATAAGQAGRRIHGDDIAHGDKEGEDSMLQETRRQEQAGNNVEQSSAVP